MKGIEVSRIYLNGSNILIYAPMLIRKKKLFFFNPKESANIKIQLQKERKKKAVK
jgi:hypothetical protein